MGEGKTEEVRECVSERVTVCKDYEIDNMSCNNTNYYLFDIQFKVSGMFKEEKIKTSRWSCCVSGF